ncbi:unnamed protein product [Phytomonas sp. EM1]|nr:unnamed protein product [Phytomonas sp. EM1]|eukprot:CCW60610.1 unnamed protein product [Phytomonas sp. isolate EM1]
MQKLRNILILTGAGISVESGLSTFRDSNGLWCNHRIEDVATLEAFALQPEVVQRFYNERRRKLQEACVKPNAAHYALARLQREMKGNVHIVTQNVDNLHERAGSTDVVHMHGELLKARCRFTDEVFDIVGDIDPAKDRCTCCNELGTLRPHIVWFGEMPLFMEKIEELLSKTELFVCIGSSGQVYPAAGFVTRARFAGAKTLEINIEKTGDYNDFSKTLIGKASEVVPKWVDSMLDGSFV